MLHFTDLVLDRKPTVFDRSEVHARCPQPPPKSKAKSQISILGHLNVTIRSGFVGNKPGFEAVSNGSPCVYSLHVFVRCIAALYDTIRACLLPWASQYSWTSLLAVSKVCSITETYAMLVLRIGVLLEHSSSILDAPLSMMLADEAYVKLKMVTTSQ